MSGLLIGGKEVVVPELVILNQNDDVRLKLGKEDAKKRTSSIRQIILHSTRGIPGGQIKIPQYIKPGGGGDLGREFITSQYWLKDPKSSAAPLIIDADGSIGCICDLLEYATYHAAQKDVNASSIGIEMYQLSDGGIYQATLDSCVKLVNALTEIFWIQRQVHLPYKKGPIKRLSSGGRDCVGVFGHRDVSGNRGLGDPGDIIMEMLVQAGYEKFDFSKNQDLHVWNDRQISLGIKPDGVPGSETFKALQKAGYIKGLWALGKEVRAEVVAVTPDMIVSEEEVTVVEKSFWQKIKEFLERIFGN